MDSIVFLTAAEMARAIRQKQFSAVEALEVGSDLGGSIRIP